MTRILRSKSSVLGGATWSIVTGKDYFGYDVSRNPFSADQEHLHHYMIKNFNIRISQVYIFVLNIIPFCLYQLYKSLYVIFVTIAAYTLIYILLFIKKKINVS